MRDSAVCITHPFHPRCGQALDVFACRVQWGEERVFYHDAQGHQASLPSRWTSLVAADPYVALAAGRSRFRLQDLIELTALLQELTR